MITYCCYCYITFKGPQPEKLEDCDGPGPVPGAKIMAEWMKMQSPKFVPLIYNIYTYIRIQYTIYNIHIYIYTYIIVYIYIYNYLQIYLYSLCLHIIPYVCVHMVQYIYNIFIYINTKYFVVYICVYVIHHHYLRLATDCD